ncbi:DUF4145 domain-containing protein [Priestia sp. TGN 0903]|uniref:DUF4145 domain-containing protein n=1 Tax=Priestia sp. TGN 0903 TaxID=3420730 RepID=UPI003D77CD01
MKQLGKKVYCSMCKQKTKHNIVQTYEERSNPDDDFQWYERYHIVKCAGCDNAAFVKQYSDEDTWEYINNDIEWTETIEVYPEEPPKTSEKDILYKMWQTGEAKKKAFKNLPENLSALYKQIIHSFSMGYNILCASGLRTLIEGICKHLGINQGYIYNQDGTKKLNPKNNQEILAKNLAGSIFGLFESGHITFTHALILQKIKVIGNDAIHDIVTPLSSTLEEVIKIVERIIYDIYELRNHKLLQE